MHRLLSTILIAILAAVPAIQASVSMEIIDKVSFFDGYLVENIPEDAPDDGTLRLYTYLNSVKLTDEQLSAIGEHLQLDVNIRVWCDNYDRIGSVNLAFIPKGAEDYTVKYTDEDPMRIEIARFITPFMHKNKSPKTVPYTYQIDNLSRVLRDKTLREAYDIWLELEVFGVPYAAQKQIPGCSGCNEVFRGQVILTTDDEPAPLVESGVFVPVTTRRSDWRGDRGMNNYNAACTDEVGKTVKTWTFDVPHDVKNGRMVIIMSNHGAGTNGEEYVRRMHYASFDGESALEWKPGRPTCEPWRVYNTQGNGIYGYVAMSDERWQSFSNWCPGAPIPYQTFETGPLSAGTHAIKIEVPDAQFYGNDGYFPVSIYFQGDTESETISAPADFGELSSVESVSADNDYATTVRIVDGQILVTSPDGIVAVEMYTLDGKLAYVAEGATNCPTLSCGISHLDSGLYVIAVRTPHGVEAHKQWISDK